MNSRLLERTVARMERLAAAGRSTDDLMDEAGALLQTALPHESRCWHTTDPDSLIETGFRAYQMPPPDVEVARFAYLPDDYNAFGALATGRRRSGVLSEATGRRLDRSVRYRELLRPNGITGELRVALVAGGACWGTVSLFREAPGDFTDEECAFAHAVSGALGRGLRVAGLRDRVAPGSAARWPGVLVVDRSGAAVSVTPPARTWLAELGADPDGPPELPFAVHALAERARAGQEATARVRTTLGRWLTLHASTLDGTPAADQVAVIVQEATPEAVAPLLYAAFGFTAREREIVDAVIEGGSTEEIAARLFISPLTVQKHLSSIFAKTGVRSRRRLAGLLTGSANTRNLA
ncbi:helix-turn-helix transcriptional regulator [Pseudonocardia sp. CA-107938]|uniref:helix-turn-helix transcriptional regulator n=1 Tax=Pseudonocardia sp. CA-107938 TaxID=3240021 RepID=UPI003D8D709B